MGGQTEIVCLIWTNLQHELLQSRLWTDEIISTTVLAFIFQVRPFYMEDLALQETSLNPDDPDIAKKVQAYCAERVDGMIDKAGTGSN